MKNKDTYYKCDSIQDYFGEFIGGCLILEKKKRNSHDDSVIKYNRNAKIFK